MQQTHRSAQVHVRRVYANDLAAHATQGPPVRFGAQAPAVDDRFRLDIFRRNLGVPVQRHSGFDQGLTQRTQEAAIVELSLTRQIEPTWKSRTQAGFEFGEIGAIEFAHPLLWGQLLIQTMQAAAELAGLIAVLAVPDDHRAVLLEENGRRQTVQQRRPTCQTGPTQVDDQRFGVHCFRQRRQHRCRDAGGRGVGVGTTALEKLDGVPLARQR